MVVGEDVTGEPDQLNLNHEHIKAAQEADIVLSKVLKWVKGAPPAKKQAVRGLPEEAWYYYSMKNVLVLDEGGVLNITRISGRDATERRNRILIPNDQNIRDAVFVWSHQHISAGHVGQECHIT